MKRIFTTLLTICVLAISSFAQDSRNSSADNILGKYYIKYQGEESKVICTKNSDGTYKFQNTWSKNKYDKNGNVILDKKNPDKSLRNVPCDQIVLMPSLVYDAEKKVWKGKIYDPTRGIIANATVKFKDGKLNVKGSLLGIGMTVVWDPISE